MSKFICKHILVFFYMFFDNLNTKSVEITLLQMLLF